jgi:Transcriptional activator of glycolytic enzymes
MLTFCQDFKEKMRITLATAVVPENIQLDAVLPGVNLRLGHVELDQISIKQGIAKVERAVREEGEMTRSTIESALRAAVNAIPAVTKKPTTTIIQNQQSSPPPAVATIIKHQMMGAVDSVWLLYNEWKGLGDFEGVPIDGGVEALEKRFKNAWRASWRGGAKYVSRVKVVMRAIEMLHQHDMEAGVEKAIEVIEAMFQDKNQGNRRISNLARHIQIKGLVPTAKPRGKSRADPVVN